MTVLKKKETSKLTEAFFEERPTKLEIPDSTLGGDVDGMGGLDNAPMPPMGADDMGGEDQMADPMGGAPDDMGGEDLDAMDEEPPMGGEDDELMGIINGLSIEDKAAVTKYAKSMADDSEGDEMPQGDMPMESRVNMKSIIDETINDVLDDRVGTTRPQKKLPRAYRDMVNPFISPF